MTRHSSSSSVQEREHWHLLFSCVTLIPIRLNANLCWTISATKFPAANSLHSDVCKVSEVWVCSVTQILESKVWLFSSCVSVLFLFLRIIPPCDPTADDRLYHICITAISVSLISCCNLTLIPSVWLLLYYTLTDIHVLWKMIVFFPVIKLCKVWLS